MTVQQNMNIFIQGVLYSEMPADWDLSRGDPDGKPSVRKEGAAQLEGQM